MRGVRRKTAEHLREAWITIPHVTQHDRADITELEQLRAKFAPRAEEAGGKMTVTAIALKVCASALKVFPQFNASIDMEKEEIVYKQYINIGVAADTDRGLLVPVIRDVDKKNIVELAAELLAALQEGTRQEAHARRDGRWHVHDHRTSAASAVRHSRQSSIIPRLRSSACRAGAWSRSGSTENLSRV